MPSFRIGVLRSVTLLALLSVIGFSSYADDPNPFDPPEARIRPPGGIASDARIRPPGGEPSSTAQPPGRIIQPNGRIQPPVGVTPERNLFELMLEWLRARIGPPIG